MQLFTLASSEPVRRSPRFYCPACKSSGLHRADMDLNNGWHHSQAMRQRYGAACCTTCTDEHRMSEDGVLLAPDEGVQDGWGVWWSSEDALEDADAAADDYARQCSFYQWGRN